MRQLDTCDFCEDAAEGVYEVVPASVAGDPKRLALCADCRTTLQSVVDPLLDAATTREPTDADDDGTATIDADAASDAAADAASDAATGADDAATETEATTEPTDAAAGNENESTAGASPRGDDSSGGVTIEVGDEDEASEAESVDDEPDAGGSPARRPSGYAKLVRLLQNRDGAMPREDLRALATNAYDLGSREFEDALEAAVENADVEETDDGLRTL